jgi:quercetin dioxygenase-like cupin family protein
VTEKILVRALLRLREPLGSREVPMLENPRTGEQIEFTIRTPELLVIDTVWTRPGHRAVEHVHPEMEECFEVIEGRAAFRINGEERVAAPGQVVIVPPGTPHLAWNPTDGPVRLRITMRPALRWAEFTERLFAGDSPASLLSEFSREVVLAGV